MKALTSVILSVCLVGMFSAAALTFSSFVWGDPTEFHWATIDHEGNINVECKAVVLEDALIENDAITRFAVEAVINLNSYNFLSWDQAVPRALEEYFAEYAARVYLNEFSSSRLLQSVRRNYYRSSAVSTFPAVIVDQDEDTNGRRTWTVQVPATTFYSTGRDEGKADVVEQTVHQIFTVDLIEQRPTPENFRGVAVIGMTSKKVDGQREFFRLRSEDQV